MKTVLYIFLLLISFESTAQVFKGKNYFRGDINFRHSSKTDNTQNTQIDGMGVIYNSTNEMTISNTYGSLNFGLGRFISESFAVGIRGGIGASNYMLKSVYSSPWQSSENISETNGLSFSGGGELTYRKTIISKLDLYSTLYSNYHRSDSKSVEPSSSTTKRESFNVGLNLGLQYLVNDRILLRTSLIGAHFNKEQSQAHTLGISALQGFNFGFLYLW